MRSLWLTLAFTCSFSASYAQPLFRNVNSVELDVINSRVAFVGRIETLERVDEDRLLGICRVEEALKEEHRETWRVIFKQRQNPAKLMANHSRLLISAKENEIDLVATSVVNLSDPNLAVWDATLQQLTSPKQVLDVVRDALRRSPGVVEIGSKHFMLDGTTMLMVPIDTQLEETALRLLKGKDQINRSEAVSALRYFKSESNIETLKGLFDDTDWGYLRHPGTYGGKGIRRYSVRLEAYETLRSWNVDVEMPIVDEEFWDPLQVFHFQFREKPEKPADVEVLKQFPNLKTLNLVNNFDDELFTHLPPLPNLQSLELGGKVTEASVARLRTSNLIYLRLEGKQFTDACLTDIEHMPKLEKLSFWGTSFSQSGLDTLRAARPNLQILD
ncbi:MAG: hypothetical protein AAF585_01215 [Verrucomicrobiota bacterium]